MTFAASLVTLAAVVGEASGDRLPEDEIERAAAELERLLGDAEAEADRLATWFGRRPILTLIGRGGARAAAEMGALAVKESSALLAESLEAGQFRHGPLEMAGPDRQHLSSPRRRPRASSTSPWRPTWSQPAVPSTS